MNLDFLFGFENVMRVTKDLTLAAKSNPSCRLLNMSSNLPGVARMICALQTGINVFEISFKFGTARKDHENNMLPIVLEFLYICSWIASADEQHLSKCG